MTSRNFIHFSTPSPSTLPFAFCCCHNTTYPSSMREVIYEWSLRRSKGQLLLHQSMGANPKKYDIGMFILTICHGRADMKTLSSILMLFITQPPCKMTPSCCHNAFSSLLGTRERFTCWARVSYLGLKKKGGERGKKHQPQDEIWTCKP